MRPGLAFRLLPARTPPACEAVDYDQRSQQAAAAGATGKRSISHAAPDKVQVAMDPPRRDLEPRHVFEIKLLSRWRLEVTGSDSP